MQGLIVCGGSGVWQSRDVRGLGYGNLRSRGVGGMRSLRGAGV